MIVVDASVVVTALADDTLDAAPVRARLHDVRAFAPEIFDLEVASALRHLRRGGWLDDRRSAEALEDLAALPVTRAPHRPLIRRIWELRDNVSPYDAAYVALAEVTGATLLTADRALARAPGVECAVELLT